VDGEITATISNPRGIAASFAANMATNNTPHWWLAQYSLSTNDTGAGALYDDGDGMPAWMEYIAGTDPTNMESVLSVTNITMDGTGSWIYWKGGNDVTQCLEMCRNLTSTTEQWIAILTNVPPTPTATNYGDALGTNKVRFYRIRAIR
jgi:hypothetical protein